MDLLLFLAEMKGKRGKAIREKALEYLEWFSLQERATARIEGLSKGNQHKGIGVNSIHLTEACCFGPEL